MMTIAIRLTQTRSSTVLPVKSAGEARPNTGEVSLEQEATGINYSDLTKRNEAIWVALRGDLCLDHAGSAAPISAAVANVAVSDRVDYVLGPIGSYARGRRILWPCAFHTRSPNSRGDQTCVVIGLSSRRRGCGTGRVGNPSHYHGHARPRS